MVATAGGLFHGHDLGDAHADGTSPQVHHEVDGFGHELGDGPERHLADFGRQLADESQPPERLACRSSVNRRVAGDSARQCQQQGDCLAVPYLAHDGHVGRHSQETSHQASQVDRCPLGTTRSGLHSGHVGQRNVELEHLFGGHDSQVRLKLRGAASQQRRLAAAGRACEEDRQPGAYGGTQEFADLRGQRPDLCQVIQVRECDSRELADVEDQVPAAADVGMDNVQAGAIVELGVLESLTGIQLAMGCRRLIDDSRQRAPDVLVVVKGLVMVSASSMVPFDEDLVRCVDHDLPHVGIGQQLLERSVAEQVAPNPVSNGDSVGDCMAANAALEAEVPTPDLLMGECGDRTVCPRRARIHPALVGALRYRAFDLRERHWIRHGVTCSDAPHARIKVMAPASAAAATETAPARSGTCSVTTTVSETCSAPEGSSTSSTRVSLATTAAPSGRRCP